MLMLIDFGWTIDSSLVNYRNFWQVMGDYVSIFELLKPVAIIQAILEQ